MSKIKGSKAERELFKMLWDNGWSVVRSAGSGAAQVPSPDLIAGNNERFLALECKSLKIDKKYFYQDEIDQLNYFSSRFGAEPWIGVRFDKKGWWFVHTKDLERSGGNSFLVSLDFAKEKGLTFEELIKKEKN
ncbi:MAG: Holliday junction resolvase Hjc [archaeon]